MALQVTGVSGRLSGASLAQTKNGRSPYTSHRAHVGWFITNHDGPGPDFPSGHQPSFDIRVISGKVFGDRSIPRAEYEKCPICRIG